MEAEARAGLIFFKGNTTEKVFGLLKKFWKQEDSNSAPSLPRMFMSVYYVGGEDEDANRFLIRVVMLAMALQLLFVYVLHLRKQANVILSPKSFHQFLYFVLACGAVVVVGGGAMACGSQNRINPLTNFPPVTGDDFKKLAENAQSCDKGPFGVGDMLITVSLLASSITWRTNDEMFGGEHFMAARALATLTSFMAHFVRNDFRELYDPHYNVLNFQVQLFALILNTVFCLFFFVPKYVMKRPILGLLMILAMCISAALGLGLFKISGETLFHAGLAVGRSTVIVLAMAVLVCGGMGMGSALFILVMAAGVHAPWLAELDFSK